MLFKKRISDLDDVFNNAKVIVLKFEVTFFVKLK